ncbi:amidase [Candidatus Collierbacteria bacterium]|nr:amidase [Candidatus Collierbacteria bacterium]
MNDLFLLGAWDAVRKIQANNISAIEFVTSCLDQIGRTEPNIHAWVHLDRKYALAQAAEIDKKIAAGQKVGILAGVPVGVKDIFNTVDFPTEMGSPIWKNFTPGNDARVVSYLRWEDAVIPGKTVTAEFAVHTPGPTHNPHRHGYMTGTSSSGSAAAVASFMVPFALGTQTAGSTIRPASYCGVYGMKPSFGLLPRTGMLKTTDSLDTVGFFSRSIDDLRLLLDVLRVKGRNFPYIHRAVDRQQPGRKNKHKWKVGVVTSSLWVWDKAEVYARDSLKRFASALSKLKSVEIQEVKLPAEFNRAHQIHGVIYDKTLSYYFKNEFKKKTLISPVMYEIIERGQRITLDDYKKALDRQSLLSRKFARLMDNFDVLLTLSTGGEALKGLQSVDRLDSCLIWTLCGAPTINLPVFIGPNKLPFGAQLVGRRYGDYGVLLFASFLITNGISPRTADYFLTT